MARVTRLPSAHRTPLPALGLYAVTDAGPGASAHLRDRVAAAIRGGAKLVQYRDKSGDPARRREEAEALLALCREHAIPLIVNDDVDLAGHIGADGVHLGRDDATVADARIALGADAIIGSSCYADLDRALEAESQGADYVAFGAFFPSRTKPHATPVSAGVVEEARRRLRVPIAGIGGITPGNGAQVVRMGVAFLAVVNGLFGHPDVEEAARAYRVLFR